MKILKYLIVASLLMVLAISCNKGIDPISSVAPGPDTAAPSVLITYPIDGTPIRVPDSITTVTFKFEASDDIELKKVTLLLDGTEISTFSSFIDYRRAVLTFNYNNLPNGDHTLTVVATDLSDKSTTLTRDFKKVPPYIPLAGEVFYMPFDGDYIDLVNFKAATIVGSPGFAVGKTGQAYAGATDAYLTFPTTDMVKTSEFSATFWMKVNAVPDRAGILIASPEDITNAGYPAIQNKRTSGFRFFREASGDLQQFKGNVGEGGILESWNDGGTIDPASNEWAHFAFTISETKSTIYINGVMVREADVTPIDWTGCDLLCIMSGVPRFTEWLHYSDLSLLDDLRIFNKALTADEVNQIYIMK